MEYKKNLFVIILLFLFNFSLYGQLATNTIKSNKTLNTSLITNNNPALKTINPNNNIDLSNTNKITTNKTSLLSKEQIKSNNVKIIQASTFQTQYSSTSKSNKIVETPGTLMVTWGFFILKPESAFNNQFSEGTSGSETYYRMPFNSWNDSFYFYLRFDWDLFPFLNTRAGWSIGFNFAGSGDSNGSTIYVPQNSALGQAYGGPFYASYNSYNFPVLGYIRIEPLQLWIFKIYTGLGLGFSFGIYSYNEFTGSSESTLDTQYDEDVFKIVPIGMIFIGTEIKPFESFPTLFFEINYKFSQDPIMHNDYLNPQPMPTPPLGRNVAFQVSGLSIGFGLKY